MSTPTTSSEESHHRGSYGAVAQLDRVTARLQMVGGSSPSRPSFYPPGGQISLY